MTVIPANALQTSDLRLLGHNLPARVRRDHDEVYAAINRSLAVHDEGLSAEDAAAIDAALAGESVAS